jgi:hypothetical protein
MGKVRNDERPSANTQKKETTLSSWDSGGRVTGSVRTELAKHLMVCTSAKLTLNGLLRGACSGTSLAQVPKRVRGGVGRSTPEVDIDMLGVG